MNHSPVVVINEMKPLRKITKKWTMANGEKIRICDMTDRHLINTINFLERMHFETIGIMESFSSTLHGDMATYLMGRDIDAAIDGGPSEQFPLYDDLCFEAKRRGLEE